MESRNNRAVYCKERDEDYSWKYSIRSITRGNDQQSLKFNSISPSSFSKALFRSRDKLRGDRSRRSVQGSEPRIIARLEYRAWMRVDERREERTLGEIIIHRNRPFEKRISLVVSSRAIRRLTPSRNLLEEWFVKGLLHATLATTAFDHSPPLFSPPMPGFFLNRG